MNVRGRIGSFVAAVVCARCIPGWLALIACVGMSFAIYGRLLFSPDGFAATGDFGPAVSYAMNFDVAVDDGQWLPRWIVGTREKTFTSGTMDGTPPIIGSPVFIYYGFLQSAIAFPLLRMGIDAINALELTVCLAFAMSAWVLYRAARVLGANGVAALVGAFAYLISPWLISNFYHRGGISEALAQAGLPFFVLAFAYLSVQRRLQAALWSAVGIAWMALAHNVFLLHSAAFCVLFTGIYSLRGKVRLDRSLVTRLEPAWVIGGGVAIGLLAVAWQWYPVLLTLHEISFQYDGTIVGGGIVGVADLSGALGWPQQFVKPEIGVTQPTDFYMTIGWWVLPSAVLLVLGEQHRRLRAGLLGCFVWFMLLTFEPGLLTPLLPSVFGATQFSFRLLSYLSVIGAIGLCLAWPRMPLVAGVVLAGLMTASQIPVLNHQMLMQKLPDEVYLDGYEYNAFYANSPHANELRRWFDGWLNNANSISFDGGASALRVRGVVDPRVHETTVYLSPLADPARPVSDVVAVDASFDVTLVPRAHYPVLRLMTTTTYDPAREGVFVTTTLPREGISYSIRPHRVSLLPEQRSSYVFAEQMELTAEQGYTREFRCRPQACVDLSPDAAGRYSVELPMIYNRFSIPTQDGQELQFDSDFQHGMLVRAPRLDAPILVRYQTPPLSLIMTALGVLGLLGVIYQASRIRRPDR